MSDFHPMGKPVALSVTHSKLPRGHPTTALAAPIRNGYRHAVKLRRSLVKYWQQFIRLGG